MNNVNNCNQRRIFAGSNAVMTSGAEKEEFTNKTEYFQNKSAEAFDYPTC